jgi:glycosyltransferase involved in cell wall biosynthesis
MSQPDGERPFFSLVTACRDGLPYLRETIPLIVGQTFASWEWIIVDDGSATPLAEVCRDLLDPRMQWIRREQSQGQTKGLNEAIRRARADWIVRLDGDDLPSLDRLALTREALGEAGAGPLLLFSDYDVVEENGQFLCAVRFRSVAEKGHFLDYLEKRNNPICHPTVAFRKLQPDGSPYQYNEQLRNAQDYELWRRILIRDQGALVHVPRSLLKYRLVKSSLSGGMAKEQRRELQLILAGKGMASEATGARALSALQSLGMHSFRKLYYHFISARRDSSLVVAFGWLLESLLYPVNAGRAFSFWLFSFARRPAKRLLFNDIYL